MNTNFEYVTNANWKIASILLPRELAIDLSIEAVRQMVFLELESYINNE